jgi:Zn-dependent protease
VFGPVRASGKPQLRLFGVPIRIEPVFFVIIVLLGIGPGTDATLLAGWVAIVFFSVLLHELAHAVAFMAFGSKPSIILYGLGGVTTAEAPARRWQSIVVSLAGPVVPLVLVGLPALVAAESEWARESEHQWVLLHMAVWVNVWWGLVNLLPLVPLDGGHVAEEIVGPKAARVLTIVIAVPIAVYAVRQDVPFGAILAGLCAYQAWGQLRGPQRAAGRAAEHSMSLTVAPDRRWADGARLFAAGRADDALAALAAAAHAEPPPPPAVVMIGDSGLAAPLVERLLASPGERPPVAVAEIASGLLSAGRHRAAADVAERLARDPRSPALREWAGSAAALAWEGAGDPERAARWAAWAAELGPKSG